MNGEKRGGRRSERGLKRERGRRGVMERGVGETTKLKRSLLF